MPKISLSPTLFLSLSVLILLPSFMFLLGLVLFIFLRNTFLYRLVINENILQSIGVLVLSPLSGGILSYGYLERYKAKGWSAKLSKMMLAYSITFLGLIAVYYVTTLFS